MKFLKLVSCFSMGTGEGKEVVAETVRRTEEATALMARKVRRKRRVSGGAEWKPTLGSISEDNIPVVVGAAAQGAVKRKSSSEGASYGGPRGVANYEENYDHRRGRYTSVCPAFAPTPLML